VVQKLGIDLDRPIKRLSETHDILRDIVRTGKCTYEGEIYSLENWKLRAEFQNDIPLYVAGMGPKMQELAAAKLDGLWLPFNVPVPFAADVVERGHDYPREFARDVESFLYALNGPTVVGDEDSELRVGE